MNKNTYKALTYFLDIKGISLPGKLANICHVKSVYHNKYKYKQLQTSIMHCYILPLELAT